MNKMSNLEEVRMNAERLISQLKSSIIITDISRVKDLRFIDKIYDVFVIDTLKNGKYILKLDSTGYETKVYVEIFQHLAFATPVYLGGMQDSQNRCWFLSHYVSDLDLVSGSLVEFCIAAKQLAKIHSSFFRLKPGELDFLKHKPDKIMKRLIILENAIKDGKVQIPNQFFNTIRHAAQRLICRPQTFIHDDLLPINILAGEDGVYFIDWANAALGCYAHDLGRLLGDLKDESEEHWVRPEWRQSILEAYYEAVSLPEYESWTWQDFQTDFNCSCLWNYAEIVIAHIMNGWDLSMWYEVNFKYMIKYVSVLQDDSI